MRKIYSLLLFLFIGITVYSQTTYTYTGIGEWTETTNWSPSYPGTTISETDEVIISTDSEVITYSTTINGKLTIDGELESRSTLTINGELVINGELESRSTLSINGTATNNGTHQSSSFFKIYGVYTNKATLQAYSITDIYTDGVLNNENTFSSVYLYNTGTLNNTGTYTNNLFLYGDNNTHTSDFTNNKRLLPGTTTNSTSIGTYNFDANLTLGSGSTLYAEIKSITEVDLVNVSNTATIGGNLEVNLIDDYDPAIGTTYTIVKANAITGTFSSITYPDLDSDKMFTIIYNSNSVELEVVNTLSTNSYNNIDYTLSIYPNPALDVLNINNVNEVEDVIIYSALGQKIKTITLNSGKNSINVSNLNKGVYILLINKQPYRFIKK